MDNIKKLNLESNNSTFPSPAYIYACKSAVVGSPIFF